MLNWKPPYKSGRAAHLCDLFHECVGSSAMDQGGRLADASWLLASAADEARLQVLISCGAYESAAALVIGVDRPYLVSRGANGVCLASVLLADGSEETTVEAATPALALLAAHVAALLAEESRATAPVWRYARSLTTRLH